MKKEKAARPEVRKEVWCLKCKKQGNDNDHCPIFVNYIIGGGPMPLGQGALVGPSAGPALWCVICQVARKHVQTIFICCKSLYRCHKNCSTISTNQWAMMSDIVEAMT